MEGYYIGEHDFRVFSSDLMLAEEKGDEYNSRKIAGVMSTERVDRQDERVIAKGLDFEDFLANGHFNDNHSQETASIIGYPEEAKHHEDLGIFRADLKGTAGWTCKGYLLKGTRRANDIWELAKALQGVPNRKLGFSIEGKVLRRGNKCIEKARIRNVAITNCFPGDVRVTGTAQKITRRWYSGPMVEIHLATGEKLTGTPNHPIFTNRGWVSLGLLNERLHRIGHVRSNRLVSTVVAHDVENVPTRLEQIFDLARFAGAGHRVDFGRKSQFHGDGRDGDVDVVFADGFLRKGLEAAFEQKFGQFTLSTSDKELESLAGNSAGFNLLVGGRAAAASYIGGDSKALAFGGGAFGIAQQIFFSAGPGDPETFGDIIDRLTSDAVTFSDEGRALSPAIGFSDLVGKRVFDFCGHVFNLDTRHGWYDANSIIVHNCPVNTDATWNVLAKSFVDADIAVKALAAGYGTSPSNQTGGAALPQEDLDADFKRRGPQVDSKKRAGGRTRREEDEERLKRAFGFEDLLKAMEMVRWSRPDLSDESVVEFAKFLFKVEAKYGADGAAKIGALAS